MLNPEESILTFALRQGLNSDRPESEALKFRKQWTYLKTMKEVKEYALSHVDVEDFKSITGTIEHKGKTLEKGSEQQAERHDRGKKLVRIKDFDVPGLNNFSKKYTLKRV